MSVGKIRLLVRGDDAGSCVSANEAVAEACAHGAVRNASVMMCGPAFQEAAPLLNGLSGVAVGLHVTLNAEWDGPKWGPVLGAAAVPSLVDPATGFFLPTPGDLNARGFEVSEAIAEVEAQLAVARRAGLKITYLDEHMGVGWAGGLRAELAALCRREGLIEAHAFQLTGFQLRGVDQPADDLAARWLAALGTAAPGDYRLVTHPGKLGADMMGFFHAGQTPGDVARERDAERRALTDPKLLAGCAARGIALIRYDDL